MGRSRCWCCCEASDAELYEEIDALEDQLEEAQAHAEMRVQTMQEIVKQKDDAIKRMNNHNAELHGYLKLAEHSFLAKPVRVIVTDAAERFRQQSLGKQPFQILLERFVTLPADDVCSQGASNSDASLTLRRATDADLALALAQNQSVREFFERSIQPLMRYGGEEVETLDNAALAFRPPPEVEEKEKLGLTADVHPDMLRLIEVESIEDELQRYMKLNLRVLQFYVVTKTRRRASISGSIAETVESFKRSSNTAQNLSFSLAVNGPPRPRRNTVSGDSFSVRSSSPPKVRTSPLPKGHASRSEEGRRAVLDAANRKPRTRRTSWLIQTGAAENLERQLISEAETPAKRRARLKAEKKMHEAATRRARQVEEAAAAAAKKTQLEQLEAQKVALALEKSRQEEEARVAAERAADAAIAQQVAAKERAAMAEASKVRAANAAAAAEMEFAQQAAAASAAVATAASAAAKAAAAQQAAAAASALAAERAERAKQTNGHQNGINGSPMARLKRAIIKM